MSIIGLTDRQSVVMRFPQLGKLRKGKLVQNPETGKWRPVDLDHFRFTSEEPAIEAAFKAVFGEEPRGLRVFLPFVTVEDNFSTAMEEWVAGGMVHRCDGQTMSIWQGRDGKYSREQKPCPYHAGEKKRDLKAKPPIPGCVPCGRLALIIPELIEVAGRAGYVTLETHSKNDLRAIMASLINAADIQEINHNPRGLRGVEFRLWRQEMAISTPSDDGKRARRKKWMVQLAPAISWIDVQYQIDRREALQLEAGEEIEADAEEETEFDSAASAPAEYAAERPIEGEFQQAEEQTDSDPGSEKPAGGNGKGQTAATPAPTRPYAPDVVKRRIALTVQAEPDLADRLAEPRRMGLMAGKIAEALGNGEAGTQGRHLALEFLFGKKSSNQLDAAEVNAVLRWLVGERGEDGHYVMNPLAVEELKRIVTRAQESTGQAKLL